MKDQIRLCHKNLTTKTHNFSIFFSHPFPFPSFLSTYIMTEQEQGSAQKKETHQEAAKFSLNSNLPYRFQNPQEWDFPQGRKSNSKSAIRRHPTASSNNPLYATTSSQYGQPPSRFEMPYKFHGVSQAFSKHLSQAGPFRNNSLNMK